MRILMTGADPAAGRRARAALEEAGHEVLACSDDHDGHFPCRGLAGEDCPVDVGAVVAVSAPGTIPLESQPGEVGLICALRYHLPVVVADEDLLDAVESAAAAPLPRHTEVVVAEARRLVDGADASVVRVGGGLRVDVVVPEAVSRRTAELIAVRSQGAIRAVDRWASVVDVTVEHR